MVGTLVAGIQREIRLGGTLRKPTSPPALNPLVSATYVGTIHNS